MGKRNQVPCRKMVEVILQAVQMFDQQITTPGCVSQQFPYLTERRQVNAMAALIPFFPFLSGR
jgi:hypothetical protein